MVAFFYGHFLSYLHDIVATIEEVYCKKRMQDEEELFVKKVTVTTSRYRILLVLPYLTCSDTKDKWETKSVLKIRFILLLKYNYFSYFTMSI